MNIETVFTTLATLAWILAIGVAILIATQKVRQQPIRRSGWIIGIVLGAAIILTLISAGLVFINPQDRGVVISAIMPEGYRQEALEPGLSWIVPFVENVIIYPVSKQTYTMSISPTEGQKMGDDSIEARTADGQKVLIDASVIFSIDPQEIVQVHVDWQSRYDSDLVRPVTRGVIRDAVSQFGIEEVYSSKRDELVTNIESALDEAFSANGIILHNFVLRNISFSEEYAASVEQKQIAEQQAQEASFVIQQRKYEADQARATAEGLRDATILEAEGQAEAYLLAAKAEAEALELINQVINKNPNLINYLYIQQLAPNVRVMFLPSQSPYLFDLSPLMEEELDDLPPLTLPQVEEDGE
jgi:regulator of protease activity HflC (stomatin/prohibitin superfamily)